MRWLKQAENHIGCTVKVDLATLVVSRGKFARGCVEVDLNKPLMEGYRMRGEYYRSQYEELHDLCFGCGRYGHRDATYLEKLTGQRNEGEEESSRAEASMQAKQQRSEDAGYGEWTMVQRNFLRQERKTKGNTGNLPKGSTAKSSGGDHGRSQ